MSEAALQRLLVLSSSLPNVSLRQEQRSLVNQLAQELNISLADATNGEESLSPRGEETKKSPREEINTDGASSAREKFKRQEKQNNQEQQASRNNTIRREARKSVVKPATSNGTGNSDCDISSPAIKEAYVHTHRLPK